MSPASRAMAFTAWRPPKPPPTTTIRCLGWGSVIDSTYSVSAETFSIAKLATAGISWPANPAPSALRLDAAPKPRPSPSLPAGPRQRRPTPGVRAARGRLWQAVDRLAAQPGDPRHPDALVVDAGGGDRRLPRRAGHAGHRLVAPGYPGAALPRSARAAPPDPGGRFRDRHTPRRPGLSVRSRRRLSDPPDGRALPPHDRPDDRRHRPPVVV